MIVGVHPSDASVRSEAVADPPPGYASRSPSILSTSVEDNNMSLRFADPPSPDSYTLASHDTFWSPNDLYADPMPQNLGHQENAVHSSAVMTNHNESPVSSSDSGSSTRRNSNSSTGSFTANSSVYTFVPYESNSMVVAQCDSTSNGGILNLTTKYHVSFRMNSFLPDSYVTVVRRKDERGEIVGDFEMGPPGAIFLRGNQYKLHGFVLTKERTMKRLQPKKLWNWNYTVAPLRWDCSKFPFICRLKDQPAVIARFHINQHRRQAGYPESVARLEVLPEGDKYFDDILFSILIIERDRRNRGEGQVNHPFKASDPVPWLWQ